ncbi:hypothetical protein DFH11DRAFT_1467899, partial [Phellopilus nigrolimitatus]
KKPDISMPYNPMHLTRQVHASTGEVIGLPHEWQQLLLDSDRTGEPRQTPP